MLCMNSQMSSCPRSLLLLLQSKVVTLDVFLLCAKLTLHGYVLLTQNLPNMAFKVSERLATRVFDQLLNVLEELAGSLLEHLCWSEPEWSYPYLSELLLGTSTFLGCR